MISVSEAPSNPVVNEHPRADALGFLAPQAQPPDAIPDLAAHVDLMHVTAAPPIFDRTVDVLYGANAPDGRPIPGLEGFAEHVGGQDGLRVVTSRLSLDAAMTDPDRTGIILGLQRAPADVLRRRNQMSLIHDLGVRVMALEYRFGNGPYGSGWLDPDGPLTHEGGQLIEAMADHGIILDLSHSGARTATDALDYIERRGLQDDISVMASHGGIREAFDGDPGHVNSRRNLPADTLRRIAALGGVAGIYALTFGLSDHDNSAGPMFRQIHEADRLLGDAVVIGSDATYRVRDMDEWRATHAFMLRNVVAGTEMEPRFPDTPLEQNTPGRLGLIRDRLVADGMTEDRADDIVGRRLVRFFGDALAA